MPDSMKNVLLAALALLVLSGAAYSVKHAGATPAATPSVPSATAAPSPSPSAAYAVQRADFLGDSYTAGSGASGPTKSFAFLTAKAFGWAQINHGQGGTGYVADGRVNSASFGPLDSRVGDVVAARPDLVIVQAGYNDGTFPVGTVGAAATKTLQDLTGDLPGVPVVVVGPFSPSGAPSANLLAVRDRIEAAAAEVRAAFIDPLREKWLTPQDIGPDGFHPTDAGHAIIARRLAQDLRSLGFTHS